MAAETEARVLVLYTGCVIDRSTANRHPGWLAIATMAWLVGYADDVARRGTIGMLRSDSGGFAPHPGFLASKSVHLETPPPSYVKQR